MVSASEHASGTPTATTDGWTQLASLRGRWWFRLGDDPRWSAAAIDLDSWESIAVPGAWEDQGYSGYDGYAWYRTRVHLRGEAARRAAREPVYLSLGRIDDVDAVWVNGHFIGGMGGFPERDFVTAYFAPRLYRVPAEYLDTDGTNTIAIRVFDAELAGGILDGAIGLYVPDDPLPLAVDLAGPWRFRTGDNLAWANPSTSEIGWSVLTVPASWEAQGYPDYNGYAWYRRTAEVSAAQARTPMVLLLGKIDDLDEVWVNGQRIGGTGDIARRQIRGDEWQVRRAYPVPEGVLRPGKDNVIAVRVYDGLVDGGIFEGPVGLMEADTYRRLTRGPGAWDRFVEFLSGWWPGG